MRSDCPVDSHPRIQVRRAASRYIITSALRSGFPSRTSAKPAPADEDFEQSCHRERGGRSRAEANPRPGRSRSGRLRHRRSSPGSPLASRRRRTGSKGRRFQSRKPASKRGRFFRPPTAIQTHPTTQESPRGRSSFATRSKVIACSPARHHEFVKSRPASCNESLDRIRDRPGGDALRSTTSLAHPPAPPKNVPAIPPPKLLAAPPFSALPAKKALAQDIGHTLHHASDAAIPSISIERLADKRSARRRSHVPRPGIERNHLFRRSGPRESQSGSHPADVLQMRPILSCDTQVVQKETRGPLCRRWPCPRAGNQRPRAHPLAQQGPRPRPVLPGDGELLRPDTTQPPPWW